jgi:hypothetical protein
VKPMTSIRAAAVLAVLALAACGKDETTSTGTTTKGIPGDISQLPGHDSLAQDTTPKQGPRLLPAEAYLRTYLQIFGGKTPQEVETLAKQDNLFREWSDYLKLIGLPDHGTDIARAPETNPLMLATFERLGIALCDRTLESDWKAATPVAVDKRRVFAFDAPPEAASLADFTPGFDVMHRTFLGYPAKLAPAGRAERFHKLYTDVVAAHDPAVSPNFTPAEAGWAAVCYGLVRHPELHLY